MNKIKDVKTSVMGFILMASEFFNMMGIEIPDDWSKYLMIAGGGLLMFAGDPKTKDFISKTFREKIDNAQNNFANTEIQKNEIKQIAKEVQKVVPKISDSAHDQNVQTNLNI
jgi:hypothetical protein